MERRPVDDLILQAYRLHPDELQELYAAIHALIESNQDKFRVQEPPETQKMRTLSPGSGSIERKIINGCGPYLYLRYWSGGRHKSLYLGKEKNNNSCL